MECKHTKRFEPIDGNPPDVEYKGTRYFYADRLHCPDCKKSLWELMPDGENKEKFKREYEEARRLEKHPQIEVWKKHEKTRPN